MSGAPAFAATPISSDVGVLILSSETTGAEIYIDGKFVGDAPTIISLASGLRQITIKSMGKKDWTREIEVMEGSQVTRHAVFVQSP
jgi:hypothetical protein